MYSILQKSLFLHTLKFYKWRFFLLLLHSALQPLVWVWACSTVVDHSQQEGFTECRYQRHIKPPTWRRTRDLERSNFRHKRPPASEATPANPAAEGFGRLWTRELGYQRPARYL
jgi:hypothetical protein